MKKVIIILYIQVLLFIPVSNVVAQSLPNDLDAAVKMSTSGFNTNYSNTMMNYKVAQKNQLKKTYNRKDEIILTIKQKKKDSKNIKGVGWTSLLVTAITSGICGYFVVSGNEAYKNYMNATITADAVNYREQFQIYDQRKYVSLGIAGIGAMVSVISFSNIPSIDKLDTQLTYINKKIESLEVALK